VHWRLFGSEAWRTTVFEAALVLLAIITVWVALVSTHTSHDPHEKDKSIVTAPHSSALRKANGSRRFAAQKVRTLVEQIAALERQVETELTQAERDGIDARKADGITINAVIGSNTAGKIVQEASALMSTAKGIKAEIHRRHARQLSGEIQRLRRELATLLSGGT
jgi:hypothetical protein